MNQNYLDPGSIYNNQIILLWGRPDIFTEEAMMEASEPLASVLLFSI